MVAKIELMKERDNLCSDLYRIPLADAVAAFSSKHSS